MNRSEEIEYGSKLIAEYMGNKMNGTDYYISGHDANFPVTHLVGPSGLEYHTSWEWIMPVVVKLYKETNHIEIRFERFACHCKAERIGYKSCRRGNDEVLNVFRTCVDIIKHIMELKNC